MKSEQYFIRLFRENFSRFKNARIALYGTSAKAAYILRSFPEYNILGVLDEAKEGFFLKKPIIKQDELVKLGIEVVIIVARNENLLTISNRIIEICSYNEIKAFSITGLHLYDIIGQGELNKIKNLKEYDTDNLLKLSRYRGILEYDLNRHENKMVTLFAQKIFSDKKAIDTGGRVRVTSLYQYAYCFVAPLVTAYVFFIIKKLQESTYDKVLFAARDSKLIQRLYHLAKDKYRLENLPDDIYFQTSRLACISAAVTTEEDFFFLDSLPTAYNPQYMTAYRFNIEEKKLKEYDEKQYTSTYDYLIANKEVILENSEECRKNYLKYMRKQGINKGERYAIVDLVSSGTCQLMISQIEDFYLVGFYMGKYEVESERKRDLLPTASFLEHWNIGEENHWKNRYLFENYWFLETIMTSFEPSLHHFDNQGNPILCKEKRTKEDMLALKEMQSGIIDYFMDFVNKSEDVMPEIRGQIVDLIYRYGSDKYTKNACPYFEGQTLFEDLGLGVLSVRDN